MGDSAFQRIKHKFTKYGYSVHKTSTANTVKRACLLCPKVDLHHKTYRIASAMLESIQIIKRRDDSIKWIFRTEDDWIFYKQSFILYSFRIYLYNQYQSKVIHRLQGQRKLDSSA